MDWFERITGFQEQDYAHTQSRLKAIGGRLHSSESSRDYAIGTFSMPSLGELRSQVASGSGPHGTLKVSLDSGDVRQMHQLPALSGALFQVASQFNMLEMTSYDVTPEQGVTRYQYDPTQGPACAIAAGAATIYRNYLVPVGSGLGQRTTRQLDGLADLGAQISTWLSIPVQELWQMRNGYCLASAKGLQAISSLLQGLGQAERDFLRSHLRIGLHQDVEVTDGAAIPNHLVSQAFCSALPVAYSRQSLEQWRSFATLVLEAAYEATLWAGVLNARRGASDTVLLTRLGGGAFGNDDEWIHGAMARALRAASAYALRVRIVSYRESPPELHALAAEFS